MLFKSAFAAALLAATERAQGGPDDPGTGFDLPTYPKIGVCFMEPNP